MFSQAILVGDVEPEPAEVALGRRPRPHGPSGGRTLGDDHRVLFPEELAFQRNEQQIRPAGDVFTMFHGGEPAHRTGEFQQEILEPAARAQQGDAPRAGRPNRGQYPVAIGVGTARHHPDPVKAGQVGRRGDGGVCSQYGSIGSSEPVARARMSPGIRAWASTAAERSPTRAMRGGAGRVIEVIIGWPYQ